MEAAANEDSLSDSCSDSDDDENGDSKSVCSTIIRHPFKKRYDIQIKVRVSPSCLLDHIHRVKELEWIEVKPEMPPPIKVPEQSNKKVFKEVAEPREETSKSTDQSDMSLMSSTSDQEIAPSTNSSEIGTLAASRLSAKKSRKIGIQPLQAEQASIAAEITASQMKERQFARAGIKKFSEDNRIKDGIGIHLLLKLVKIVFV
uniref:Uncharacterized protein n=1 Tax=Tetranychus urticae TaxID=32264 RepID=T1KCS6_TETUR